MVSLVCVLARVQLSELMSLSKYFESLSGQVSCMWQEHVDMSVLLLVLEAATTGGCYGGRSLGVFANDLLLVKAVGASSVYVWLVHEATIMEIWKSWLQEQDPHIFHQIEFRMVRRDVIGKLIFGVNRKQGSRGTVKKRIDPLKETCFLNTSCETFS